MPRILNNRTLTFDNIVEYQRTLCDYASFEIEDHHWHTGYGIGYIVVKA